MINQKTSEDLYDFGRFSIRSQVFLRALSGKPSLSQNPGNHVSMNIGQAVLSSLVAERQLRVVNPA